jgi:hypothetical protein
LTLAEEPVAKKGSAACQEATRNETYPSKG